MIEHVYRKAIIPVFEGVVKRRSTFRYWRELEQSQWWSRDRLEQLQLRRLQKLLMYCRDHSDWYRRLWARHGVDPQAVRSLHDLSGLPITTREMMRQQRAMVEPDKRGDKPVAKSTGGSSGVPLQFLIDRDANDRRVAAAFRGYAWAGAGPGTKQSHLWGVPLGDRHWHQRWKDRLYSRGLYRRDVLNSFALSTQSVPQFVRRLNRYRPRVLVAYTNPLYVLALSIAERGLRVHRPQSIIVGAEKLYDFQRHQIERSFGAPVFETYGSREFTLIGAECNQHRGLHLSMEQLIVEVVDQNGQPTPAGQTGQIVVTDLHNTAMPFVRYAIGDQAIAGWQPCPCGRGLPLLRSVVGRQLDVLRMPDGRQLPGEFFPHLLKDYPEIGQFQVIQTAADRIELRLVVDQRWSTAATDLLRQRIQQRIGDSTRLEIRLVPGIALTAAGKRRVVVGFQAAGPPSEESVSDSNCETRQAG